MKFDDMHRKPSSDTQAGLELRVPCYGTYDLLKGIMAEAQAALASQSGLRCELRSYDPIRISERNKGQPTVEDIMSVVRLSIPIESVQASGDTSILCSFYHVSNKLHVIALVNEAQHIFLKELIGHDISRKTVESAVSDAIDAILVHANL
jgi:hypothetical protein